MKADNITRENIHRFVVVFYEKVMVDNEVGSFFIDVLGEDINNKKWQEHIEILTEFWCSMVLKDGDYYGSAFAPHAAMKGLKRETFERWLVILDETLDEIYDKGSSKIFREIGTIISNNFMRNLNL